jgi:hypothetical protein
VVIIDITKRKRAEEELQQKEISLREAQNELAHVSRVTTMGELAGIYSPRSQPAACGHSNERDRQPAVDGWRFA